MIELMLTLSVLTGQTSGVAAQASSVTEQQHNEVRRSARDYRIEVYRTFRDDRAEFDRRREAGGEVLKAWFAAGRNPADSAAVVRWFEEAMQRTRSGFELPLPAPPTLAGATSESATFAAPGATTTPLTVDPAATGAAGGQPPSTFDGFGNLDPFDAPPAPTDLDTDFPAYSTTTDRGSASPSSSALDSLRRALLKAAIGAARETETGFDNLPDWPSRDAQ